MISRPYIPMFIMGLWCFALALTVHTVAIKSWGPSWWSPLLFGLAAAANITLAVRPDWTWLRSPAVGVTAAAFGWRAISIFVTWHEGGMKSQYGVWLYLGLAVMVVVHWSPPPLHVTQVEVEGRVE